MHRFQRSKVAREAAGDLGEREVVALGNVDSEAAEQQRDLSEPALPVLGRLEGDADGADLWRPPQPLFLLQHDAGTLEGGPERSVRRGRDAVEIRGQVRRSVPEADGGTADDDEVVRLGELVVHELQEPGPEARGLELSQGASPRNP